jgi:hypothetical protein
MGLCPHALFNNTVSMLDQHFQRRHHWGGSNKFKKLVKMENIWSLVGFSNGLHCQLFWLVQTFHLVSCKKPLTSIQFFHHKFDGVRHLKSWSKWLPKLGQNIRQQPPPPPPPPPTPPQCSWLCYVPNIFLHQVRLSGYIGCILYTGT